MRFTATKHLAFLYLKTSKRNYSHWHLCFGCTSTLQVTVHLSNALQFSGMQDGFDELIYSTVLSVHNLPKPNKLLFRVS